MPAKSQEGYGHFHREARAALPLPDGRPCPFCGKPMRSDQELDADHENPRVLGGSSGLRWTHSSCNRRAGATLGNMLRGRGGGKDSWENRWA